MIWIWIAAYVIIGLIYAGACIKNTEYDLDYYPAYSEVQEAWGIIICFFLWPLLLVFGLIVFIVKRIAGIK